MIDDSQMTLMIELNVPVPFFENDKGFIKILSPLQLENDLLNYWNLKQVIFIRGRRHENMKNFKGYCQKLVEQELIQAFSDEIPANIDLSLVQNPDMQTQDLFVDES